MLELSSIYKPITATPFKKNELYCEIEPCDELKPYIRCFWGTPYPVIKKQDSIQEPTIVIPDTCMDIIFDINYTKNRYNSCFCAIDEKPYKTYDQCRSDEISIFSIRFHSWSAALFTDKSLKSTKNNTYNVNDFFNDIKQELEPVLFDLKTLTDKIKFAQKILIKKLNLNRQNNDILNSLYYIISSNGTIKMSELSMKTALSLKQLERIFNEHIGLSPKSLSSLIRYQLLWQDIIYNKNFNIHNAIEKYNYFDQALLLNVFYRRHLMCPSNAMQFASKK